MALLRELFAAPVSGDGFIGDTLLDRRPAADFGWDEDAHPRGEKGTDSGGRFVSKEGGGAASGSAGSADSANSGDAEAPAAPGFAAKIMAAYKAQQAAAAQPAQPPPGTPGGGPARPRTEVGDRLTAYERGTRVASTVAAIPSQVAPAATDLRTLQDAWQQRKRDHPDEDDLHPERVALYWKIEKAEKALEAAKASDRKAVMAHLAVPSPAEFQPDTSQAGRAAASFAAGVDFVRGLVPKSAGHDPRVQVVLAGKTAYTEPARSPTGVGVVKLLPGAKPVAAAHELGHHLEFTIPGLQALCQAFHAHRVGSEAPTDIEAMGLTKAEGAKGYLDSFERLFSKDRAYYAGRVYPTGATEILPMGLEALWNDPVGFAQKDPEYFKFLVGAMSGDLLPKAARGGSPP